MCLYPRYGKIRNIGENNGEIRQKLFFVDYKSFDKNDPDLITIPCGHCIECLLQKSNEWAYRICLEAKDYEDVCMVTLTYSFEFNDGNLHKDHYQKWLKRMRKKYGKLRYFLCGEYGSLHSRPHYHCILFGKDFNDKVIHHYENGHPVYISKELVSTWSYGFSSIVDLSFWSARYCAKYLQKLQDVPSSFVQPFLSMSLKPGLGYNYFMNNMQSCVRTDKVYFNGQTFHLPRYFINIALKNGLALEVQELKEKRKKIAEISYNEEAIEKKKEYYENKLTKPRFL